MMYLAIIVGKFVKEVVRERRPSSTRSVLPTMANSFLLAPRRDVLYKWYHTGYLVQSAILGPSMQAEDFVRLKS